MRKSILTAMGLGLLLAGSAQAGTAFFDFNTDPTTSGLLTNYGNAVWISSGGAGAATNANDGFLQITAAVGSQRSAIVFADFDHGEVVKAFTFEADIRLGNGTQNPADGFSVNYVRSNDPVLVDAAAGGNPAADNNMWATGPNCEANLPEEGTQTGISIGFDTWNSDGSSPFCNEADQSIGPDIIGVDVRVDGTLVLQYPTTTQNGSDTDPTSIETGPWDGSNSYTNLGWAHLKVIVDTNAQLNVFWKGFQILTNYQTTYFPSPGALVFAGRTGGSWANQHVDNINITTIPAALALVGQASGFADGFSIQVGDSGNSIFNTNAPITLKLNGVSVPSGDVTISKPSGTTTLIVHEYPNVLVSGSTNTAFISGSDTNGNTISGTREFTVPAYKFIPASEIVSSGVGTTPGFRMLPWQSPNIPSTGAYNVKGEPNRLYWANEQIFGLHGANNANLAGATDGGYMDYQGVINFNINPSSVAGGGEAGNFRTNNGYADMLFPGIPGANGLNGSSAEELLFFLKFSSPGVYKLGVNSDDGFELSLGKNPRDRFPDMIVGSYDGGRGSSDSDTLIVVTNAGTYPMRLLWENGAGELPGNGANLEFSVVGTNGVRYLVNDPDPTNTSGVTAYFQGPAWPAFVSQYAPIGNQNTPIRPDKVLAQLTDGSTTVNQGSVQLQLNGSSALGQTVSKSGNVTTVSIPFTMSNMLPPGSSNIATLVWSDSASTAHSNAWTFTVAPYVALSPYIRATAVDTTQPGLMLNVTQIDPLTAGDTGDGFANQADSMNALLAGLYFPYFGTNTINPNSNIGFPTASNMWIWPNEIDFDVVTTGGDFTYNNLLPGIPGVTSGTGSQPNNNFAASFTGFIWFTNAGFYQMGVGSDDGFRLTQGLGITRQVLHLSGTNLNQDIPAVVSTTNVLGYGNGGIGGSLPYNPIVAPVMYVNSNNYTLGQPINLAGKVALVDRQFYGMGDSPLLSYIAETNGAVAVVVLAEPGYGTPGHIGGTPPAPINIPVMEVSGFNGFYNIWMTNGPLTATIGASDQVLIDQADFGKGFDHRDFGFVVPIAGPYPLRLLYWQGGGGAGMEWTSLNPIGAAADGERALVGDANDPSTFGFATYAAGTLVAPPPQFNPPTVSGGNLNISWTGTGTLQSTPSLSPANWTAVTPAPTGNSYSTPVTGGMKFFRLAP